MTLRVYNDDSSEKETNYLLSTETNKKALKKSIQEVERGNVKVLTSEEWDKLSSES